jgi:hypothetical protein
VKISTTRDMAVFWSQDSLRRVKNANTQRQITRVAQVRRADHSFPHRPRYRIIRKSETIFVAAVDLKPWIDFSPAAVYMSVIRSPSVLYALRTRIPGAPRCMALQTSLNTYRLRSYRVSEILRISPKPTTACFIIHIYTILKTSVYAQLKILDAFMQE